MKAREIIKKRIPNEIAKINFGFEVRHVFKKTEFTARYSSKSVKLQCSEGGWGGVGAGGKLTVLNWSKRIGFGL